MKKVIIIVVVIATITSMLCIGTNAINNGDTLKAGTEITFKNPNEIIWGNSNISYTIPIKAGNNDYYGIKIAYTAKTIQYSNNAGFSKFDNYILNNEIENATLKTVIVKEDTIINQSMFATFLTNNATIKEPSPIKDTLSNTKATFTTTLTVATAIIAWLIANQIALVGLYMYILIALIATGKRFITGV